MIPALAAVPAAAKAAKWFAEGGWRYLVGAALVLSVVAGAAALWGHGYRTAEAKCEADGLRADLADVKRQLASIQAAAAEASNRAAAAADKLRENEGVIRDYEAKLAKRPVGACALNDDDLRGLRRIRPR